jgi:hypothetical protein
MNQEIIKLLRTQAETYQKDSFWDFEYDVENDSWRFTLSNKRQKSFNKAIIDAVTGQEMTFVKNGGNSVTEVESAIQEMLKWKNNR